LKAEIRAEDQNQFTLPEEAVVQQNGKDVVFIEKEGNFFTVEIDLLMNQDGRVAITSKQLALLKHSSIVVKGAYELLAIINKEE
jgi:cobalt-zinc-cadmium efflux system membrane fusion protein